MLVQAVHALQGLLPPCLLVAGLDVLLRAAPRTRPQLARAGARWRLGGLLAGLALAVAFAALRGTAVLNRRSNVNLPILVVCVLADVAVLVVVLRSRRIVEGAGHDAGTVPGPVPVAGRQEARRPGAPGAGRVAARHFLAANAVAAVAICATVLYATPNVILQLTNFVEPGDSPFTSAMLVRAIGFLIGVGAAIAVAAIVRTMRQTAVRGAFTVAVAAFLAILLVLHAIDLIALLTNLRVIALHGTPFRLFIRVRNQALALTCAMALVFAIPAASSMVAGMRAIPDAVNQAGIRAARARRRRAWTSAVASLLAIAAAVTTLSWGTATINEVPQLSEPEHYALEDGHARILFAQVADGHLHRFEYRAADGTAMRFIVIRKNGGAYGVGLDACETCGDAGYYEKDGKIICKRCDVAINLATIGFKGGCNPVPVPYKAGNGAISIDTAELDALSSHFR